MPNWCDCDLYVAGSESDLIAFEEKARGVDRLLDANNFVPYPEKFRQMDADHPGWSPPKDATEEQTAEFEAKKVAYREKYGTDRNGYNLGGYDWCIDNWGTKWNLDAVCQVSKRRRHRSYNFFTAWSPPVPLITAMAAAFPGLRFKLRYFEGAMQFQGTFEIQGTEVYRSEYRDYGGGRGG